MATEKNYRYQHLLSNVEDKAPTPAQILDGEIAVNTFAGSEKMFIKNASGNIVSFSSDNAIGTMISDSISGKADTSAVTESINAATSGKVDTTTFETYSGNVDTAINSKLATSDFNTYSGNVDTAIGSKADADDVYTKSEVYTKTEADNKIAEAVSGKVNTSDFNTYSGAVDTAIGSKAAQSDLNTLSGTVTGHTADTTIHLTSTEKEQLHTHSNKSALDAITGNVGTAAYKSVSNGITNTDSLIESKHIYSGVGVTIAYDSNSKYIQLKNTSGSVISSFDAQSFVVDGMIESVSAGTSGSTTVLVIKWNTDAGGQETILDIGDMFEADNYYTKSQTSGATQISNALGGKVDSSTFTAHTASSVHMTSTEKTNLDSLATNIAAISGVTSAKVSNWDTAASNNHTHSNKTVLDGITSTKVSNWDGAATNSHTHSNKTVLDGITSTKVSNWDTAYANNHTHSNKTVLDGITSSDITNWNGKTSNVGTVTSVAVKMNGSVKGTVTTSGTIDLGTVITSHQDISGKADKSTTLAGYGITNAYTKTEIDNKIGDIETLLAAI